MSNASVPVLALACAACSAAEPRAPEVATRDATQAECSSGGTVLLVDGEAQAVVCNGAPGQTGAPGASGADGAQGAPGDGSWIVGGGGCSGGYPPTNTQSYVSVNYTEFSDGEAIGLCRLGRPGGALADIANLSSSTSLWCLLNDAVIDEIIEVDVSGREIRTLAGDVLSTLDCTLWDPDGGPR